MPLDRMLRYGMVGGGPGAFIGAVHRHAALLDGKARLVAGAFSSNPEKSRAQGKALFLDPDRVYGSYQEMAEAEAQRPRDERIDFVVIVTPNFLHYPVARTFLERGFHVICDKPMTNTLEDAEALCRLVEEHNRVFALTHNYSGYPMVKQARSLVEKGVLGSVRKVVVEYSQGWLATQLEATGDKQASWRTDPEKAGVAGAIGDIGTHAEHLARYVTGLYPQRILADLATFVPGRRLEDDANMLIEYEDGVKGVLICSQISVGEENNLRLRVYGTEASLEWQQEHPNELYVRTADGPERVYKRGNDYLFDVAARNSRLPSGHPEAFLEAFANVYRNVMHTIAARIAGETPEPQYLDFPTVQDGALGVNFIHKAVESGRNGTAWVDATYTPPF